MLMCHVDGTIGLMGAKASMNLNSTFVVINIAC